MTNYVDKNSVLKLFEDVHPLDWNATAYVHMIKLLPTADVKPIVRGEWLCDYEDILPHCSKCESRWTNSKNMNFCPTCGADMRKEQSE